MSVSLSIIDNGIGVHGTLLDLANTSLHDLCCMFTACDSYFTLQSVMYIVRGTYVSSTLQDGVPH